MGGKRQLRSGFTTGACAAAAAKGATLLLLGRPADRVRLRLPWGAADASEVPFALVGPERGAGWAACGVVKDAGDDPDVTDGIEIRAAVSWSSPLAPGAEASGAPAVRIRGGPGVGRVTKPGLAAAVGGPAINPVPRAMIEAAVGEAAAAAGLPAGRGLEVEIQVPRGEEVARKTLNARLGILGGISILGTTGIVIPMSAAAWCATIDAGLDVARAAGLSRVVLSHGRSSEAAAQRLLADLPPEAFILMGDYVGHALDEAARRGLAVVLAGQFAKFCKVASGHFATHVRDSRLDPALLRRLLAESGFPADRARQALDANTAREVFHRLAEEGDRGAFARLTRTVAERARDRVGGRVPVEAVLFGYDKQPLARERAAAGGGAG